MALAGLPKQPLPPRSKLADRRDTAANILLARLAYASSSKWAILLRGRKNLPAGSSISFLAEARAVRDDTASPSSIDSLQARFAPPIAELAPPQHPSQRPE